MSVPGGQHEEVSLILLFFHQVAEGVAVYEAANHPVSPSIHFSPIVFEMSLAF